MIRARSSSAPHARRRSAALCLLLIAPIGLSGCATLQQVAALRKVEFALERVANVAVVDVPIRGRRYSDLTTTEVARLAAAVVARDVPLSFVAHVSAENPASNSVSARLIRMDWTLYIEDRKTVSGRLDREYVLAPGKPVDIPIGIELDLFDFFSGRGADFFQLARAVAGVGGPTNVSLKAQPTINTPIGPIRYPGEVTIVSKTVGG